jgi:hypothetical protein
MDTTEQFCFLGAINITAAGVTHGIALVQPLLSPLLTLVQLGIGVVTIYHMVAKNRKNKKDADGGPD